jgi:deoxyribonuclease V
MEFIRYHKWNVTPREAIKIQKDLSIKVISNTPVNNVKIVAGVDVSVSRRVDARSAIVIIDVPNMNIIEKHTFTDKVIFPYIPGLLSFREIPLLESLLSQVNNIPDIIIVDGQGMAHPRRMGLACHLGILLDTPTIGCAKTPLFGNYNMPGEFAGDYTYIRDREDNIIGAVVRTKNKVKPVYVSTGHKIDLTSSINLILSCCNGYRLPEPVRLAHLASKGNL